MVKKLQAKSLLSKAKKGNNQAFIELLQDEKVKLYKMAYIYTKNENDALDVVQETIARAYANIHTVKEEQYFATWLMRILINTALEMLRKNQKIVPLEQQPEQGQISTNDEKLDLLQAIEQLDEKYKTVILLKYYRDLQIKEIADLLGCPEGTVKTNVHRGIQQLKKCLNKEGELYGERY
ncbi:sigma-70 family RNA polymerase sigma factor [Lysinibacillus agricola]|uniref:RNA polymerase sigma factor n=1 Tax=Lysinibacillus agricola TaxID=2590012 RepID=A0ABX7AR71_9BACI|nr:MULTISPECIES: sigma-70 family RNA polymerase sigma factor [Lysinibacillus]KOS63153.1 RNA polymerase subunit sigma-70 [Lysinibacillus sp. FJAT-14222]QQP12284.1 sigma-70 family RNA polymerase sigma factor [Lysinibacillus agricola]